MTYERGWRVEVEFAGHCSLGTVVRQLPSGDVLVQLDQGDLQYLPPPGQFEQSSLRRVTGCAATEL